MGNGKVLLKRVSSSVSVLQCHFGLDLNKQGGISVRALSMPVMQSRVSGEACANWRHNTSACRSCMVM